MAELLEDELLKLVPTWEVGHYFLCVQDRAEQQIELCTEQTQQPALVKEAESISGMISLLPLINHGSWIRNKGDQQRIGKKGVRTSLSAKAKLGVSYLSDLDLGDPPATQPVSHRKGWHHPMEILIHWFYSVPRVSHQTLDMYVVCGCRTFL